MEPRFIVVGNYWINVSTIAHVVVRMGSDGISSTISFVGSASEVDQNALLLKDQEATEFLGGLAAFKVS